ncbi:MAG: hypothetical protein L6Q76_26620, partial [Polyangiaceae bacterium]|nr:hypothetical protein [Polyangiaceae bacterium]
MATWMPPVHGRLFEEPALTQSIRVSSAKRYSHPQWARPNASTGMETDTETGTDTDAGTDTDTGAGADTDA